MSIRFFSFSIGHYLPLPPIFSLGSYLYNSLKKVLQFYCTEVMCVQCYVHTQHVLCCLFQITSSDFVELLEDDGGS